MSKQPSSPVEQGARRRPKDEQDELFGRYDVTVPNSVYASMAWIKKNNPNRVKQLPRLNQQLRLIFSSTYKAHIKDTRIGIFLITGYLL